MSNISDKHVQKIQIHILCSATFSQKVVPFIVWKNTAERERPQWQYDTVPALGMLGN
jgi:hypothetical protein